MSGESHTCGSDRNWRRKPDLGENLDPAVGRVGNFVRGNLGLAKTYGYAFVGAFVVRLLQSIALSLGSSLIPVIAGVAWQGTASVAVWRAAAKYPGKKLWPTLAKASVILGIIVTLAAMARL